MKVERCETMLLSVPMARPMATAVHSADRTENVLVELSAEGLVGQGLVLTLTRGEARAARAIIDQLATYVVGAKVESIGKVWQSMYGALVLTGKCGVGLLAMAALDTALWDLHAQSLKLPLSSLLGRAHDRLPAYAQGGWLSDDPEAIVDEALMYADSGYGFYKFRAGQRDWRRDVVRVAAVVEGVESEIRLMVDANQGWSRESAAQATAAMDDLGLVWIEEPLAASDVQGCAGLATRLKTPVAGGESVFGVEGLSSLTRVGAVDVLMPDLQHSGGPTGFMQIAAIAHSEFVPISGHLFTEVTSELMLSCPGSLVVEYMPGWWDGLFDESPVVKSGWIEAHERAGIGYRVGKDAKRHYGVE